MMTLDEVIENLSVKQSLKDLGHRPDPDEIADALYYLREYQEHMKWHAYEEHCLDNEKKTLQEKKAEFDEVLTDYVALRQWWTEQQENPPLSWEQLKTMEGKPVWLEWSSDGAWVLIANKVDNDLEYFRYCDDRIFVLTRDDYEPDKWQAYRKERG